MMERLLSLCVLAVLMSVPASAVIIGDWENMPTSGDGWINWSGGAAVETLSEYSVGTIGVTSGSQSLCMTKSGWGQTLSIKLQNNGLVDDFMANSIFSIDLAAPNLNNGGGWAEIQGITLNAEGWGWKGLPDTFYQFGFWADSGTLTKTFTVDYSAAKASMPANPGWVEIIITTNNDGVHNQMYFDNAQLLIPEPATLSLLGLGIAALIRRKK
jgi:hypothetical protein